MTDGRAANARPRETTQGESPSSWHHRVPVLVLVLAGLAAATDLALVQLGVLAAWDPIFGDGTRRVLFSGPARAVPVPDAAIGAVAYALEAILVIPGGPDRWMTNPRPAAALGGLAGLMAAGGVVLVLLQAFVVGAYCTLCLGSAAVSIAAAALDWPEAHAAVSELRHPTAPGRPPHAHPVSTPRR